MSAFSRQLPDNGNVVIIGGGPGGTACALALHRLAAEMGRRVNITLLEGKQFWDERHYNQCVGVLSPPLPELLEDRLSLPFPKHLCLIEIEGYILHIAENQICLKSENDRSFAVRRVQYDAYMLDAVKNAGITILPARAVDIEFHQDYVVVYAENSSLTADVVVGAFGMDEGSSTMFARATSYRPPKALESIVTKYHPGAENVACFGPFIHAWLPPNPKIEFGAITPKCTHLTINIAGSNVNSPLLQYFLNLPEVCSQLPLTDKLYDSNSDRNYFFKGRFPCSLARNYYDDRYVMVGDASGLVRAFKGKGVTTAVMTGIRAAETIMHFGISKEVFHQHYQEENQDIISDLPYGKLMRFAAINLSRFGLMEIVLRAAKNSPLLQDALFNAVSAHAPYKQVIQKTLQPESIQALFQALLQKPQVSGN